MSVVNPATGEVTKPRHTPTFRDESQPATTYADPVELVTAAFVRWARTAQIFITGACIAALVIIAISQPLAVGGVVIAALLTRRWARKGRDQR